MSQQAVEWLENQVIDRCIEHPVEGVEPEISDVVKYWSRQNDVPYDLFFLLKDGLHTVTYLAMLNMAKRCEIIYFVI